MKRGLYFGFSAWYPGVRRSLAKTASQVLDFTKIFFWPLFWMFIFEHPNYLPYPLRADLQFHD
jgi:hypothetical protein